MASKKIRKLKVFPTKILSTFWYYLWHQKRSEDWKSNFLWLLMFFLTKWFLTFWSNFWCSDLLDFWRSDHPKKLLMFWPFDVLMFDVLTPSQTLQSQPRQVANFKLDPHLTNYWTKNIYCKHYLNKVQFVATSWTLVSTTTLQVKFEVIINVSNAILIDQNQIHSHLKNVPSMFWITHTYTLLHKTRYYILSWKLIKHFPWNVGSNKTKKILISWKANNSASK